MNWQEYQEAVSILYEQAGDIGEVRRNVYIPDRITGQPRQVDTLVEICAYGHILTILVDAKFRSEKVDVKDVEEVLALADAVNASHVVLVALNGWAEPARIKANATNMCLRLLELEVALDLLVPEKWAMCSNCKEDCIVLDLDGAVEYQGLWLWWLAGRCRKCKFGFLWCQDCGEHLELPPNQEVTCGCEHKWTADNEGLKIRFKVDTDE